MHQRVNLETGVLFHMESKSRWHPIEQRDSARHMSYREIVTGAQQIVDSLKERYAEIQRNAAEEAGAQSEYTAGVTPKDEEINWFDVAKNLFKWRREGCPNIGAGFSCGQQNNCMDAQSEWFREYVACMSVRGGLSVAEHKLPQMKVVDFSAGVGVVKTIWTYQATYEQLERFYGLARWTDSDVAGRRDVLVGVANSPSRWGCIRCDGAVYEFGPQNLPNGVTGAPTREDMAERLKPTFNGERNPWKGPAERRYVESVDEDSRQWLHGDAEQGDRKYIWKFEVGVYSGKFKTLYE